MKLIDLFEDTKDKSIDDIVNTISSECSIMLAAYKNSNKILLRGTSHKNMLFSKSNIRQDRAPVEMDAADHKLINKALQRLKLPTRGNSLFVTADAEIAVDWGPIHAVFIPDGWEGLVYDNLDSDEYSFDQLQYTAQDLNSQIKNGDITADEAENGMVEFIQDMQARKFTTAKDLAKVLDDDISDILIKAPYYYKLSLDGNHEAEALQVLTKLKLKAINAI
jgi:hypothetical protein